MTRAKVMAAAANALIVAMEAVALTSYLIVEGPAMWRNYTECSNTLAAVAALACLACVVWEAAGGQGARSGSGGSGSVGVNATFGGATAIAHRLKFAACCTQLMTLVVVTFVLAPMICAAGGDGYQEMFLVGGRPVTHLLGPVLTLASYLAFEADPLPTPRDSTLALGCTAAYAAVAYTLNYLRVLNGPYPFFQVWDMPIWQTVAWFVVLLAVAWGLAQVPRVAARALAGRRDDG